MTMTSWVAEELEFETDNKIGQNIIDQSWLGFEYFSDGVSSRSQRNIVKSRHVAEESDLVELVPNIKAVDVLFSLP